MLKCYKTLIARVVAAIAAVMSISCTAQSDIAVSIKPLHSLVAGLMEGVDQPTLLFTVPGSPHMLTMRPSQRRALARARLVIRVGPDLEVVLNRPLRSLSSDTILIDVVDSPGIDQPPTRSGGAWNHVGGLAKHSHDSADGKDPHVLLSPANALAISRHITQALTALDPDNAARYEDNLAKQSAKIEALDAELAELLKPVKSMPYLVFHDAYHVFEDHYGLNAVGAFSVAPGRTPGAKRLRTLERTITQTGARCIFTEPQFSPASATQVAHNSGARIGELDPVGAMLEPGPDHWFILMRRLADSLTACLNQRA